MKMQGQLPLKISYWYHNKLGQEASTDLYGNLNDFPEFLRANLTAHLHWPIFKSNPQIFKN
jgi:hypothetical protein